MISKTDFAACMAMLSVGSGEREIDPRTVHARTGVYYDLLGDLPLAVLQAACKRALAENQYPTLPPVGVLRSLATEIMLGPQPTAAEAWRMCARVASFYHTYDDWTKFKAEVAKLPEVVRKAGECIGWRSIRDTMNPETARAQFHKAYTELSRQARRRELLPAPLREEIVRLGNCPQKADNSPTEQRAQVTKLLTGIGRE
jgi:hypothetical protein